MSARLRIVVLFSCALLGCAAPSYNYRATTKQISFPGVGEESRVSVGDTMVSQGSLAEHDALVVEQDVSVGLLGLYTIQRGTYLKEGENGGAEFYSIHNPFVEGGAIRLGALAGPPKVVALYDAEHKLCVIRELNDQMCASGASYSKSKKTIESINTFQQSLIYSGRVGTRIKLGYREFSGNRARPAFNNDVDYDLTESTVIGYKGARLEVLEATNESIRFKLISNFNASH
jgi:hypothetical protein